MNFEETLEALKQPKPCKIGKWLYSQDTKYQTTIANALDANTPHMVYRALVKSGLQAGSSAFYRHVKGECSCN